MYANERNRQSKKVIHLSFTKPLHQAIESKVIDGICESHLNKANEGV